MDSYLDAISKYAVFGGRARRREYWIFNIVNALITLGLSFASQIALAGDNPTFFWGVLSIFFGLAIFLPSLAVLVRRLHDTGRSGWWMFISFVPFIGSIWLLVLTLQDSQPGENAYGPNPKAEPVVEFL